MRKYLFLIPFLVIFYSDSAYPAKWSKLDSGLYYQKISIQRKKGSGPAKIHVFKIDPKKYDFRPLLPNPHKTASVKNLVENKKALIGVNANFFDPQSNPLGLIVSNRKIVNPFKKISWWGIFQIKGRRPSIIHSSQWYSSRQVSMAIQAGPRLVVNGKVPKLKSEISQKTAIGINRKGEVILLTTLYPFSVNELAKLMAKPESKGGLGCRYALNLDGGSSSQLYARVGSFRLNLSSYVDVPVGLGVFRK